MSEVSIIVAAYNCEDTIERCIKSLLSQSDQEFEIIICDDASEDRTVELIREFQEVDKRIILLQNDSQRFAAYSRNRCIEDAKGQYIMVQDADDYAHIDRIKILKKALRENPSYSFVSSAAALFDEDGIWGKRIYSIKSPEPVDLVPGLCFIHAATIFSKACINDVGMYRIARETRRGQDYDLFMRLYAKGHRGINIGDELYYIEEGRNSYKRRKYRYRIDEAIIRYRGYKAMELPLGNYLFVLKPLLVGLIPRNLMYLLRKLIGRT